MKEIKNLKNTIKKKKRPENGDWWGVNVEEIKHRVGLHENLE